MKRLVYVRIAYIRTAYIRITCIRITVVTKAGRLKVSGSLLADAAPRLETGLGHCCVLNPLCAAL